jgi:hypothetical protein
MGHIKPGGQSIERGFKSYEQPDPEWVCVVKKKDRREKLNKMVDRTPIKKWEHVSRDLRPGL